MKYAEGTKVFFTESDGTRIHSYIPDWYAEEEIPSNYIIHGSTALDESYETTGAEIVDIYHKFYIVRFMSEDGEYVQLGFEEENIKPMFTTWKERYGGK